MYITSVAKTGRVVTTAWHVTVHTVWSVLVTVRNLPRPRQTSPTRWRQDALKTIRHCVRSAIDPRTFFAIDGDVNGRRRRDLDRTARRERRRLADLRRRQVSVLLHALGDTAEAVQASLTRHWQLRHDDWPVDLIDDYLASRLRLRDRHAGHIVGVFPWATDIGGVWVPTPAAIRRYLRHAPDHERQLEAAAAKQPPPRRGVRTLPAAQR